jgi:hypothetical protein
MSNLEKAKELLENNEYTCVLYNGSKTYKSTLRGVAPMVKYLDDKICLKDFSAADKIVGKAAAFLFILAGVKDLYADVISIGAKNLLEQYNISVSYRAVTEYIINRNKTGPCPMELAVAGANTPKSAFLAIKAKLEELKQ